MDVHRLITRRALDGLPAPLKGSTRRASEFVVEHSVDPDLWRVAALRGGARPRGPQSLSRHRRARRAGAVHRCAARLERVSGALRRGPGEPGRAVCPGAWSSLRPAGRRVQGRSARATRPYAADNARYLSAVIAHYVEDSFQPFHAIANYDGQLTNQRGMHSRFEAELARRYWTRITHRPVTMTPIPDVKAFVFETLVEGHRLSAAILEADRKAAGTAACSTTRTTRRCSPTRAAFSTARVAGAASGVASVIVAAWTDAENQTCRPGPRAGAGAGPGEAAAK